MSAKAIVKPYPVLKNWDMTTSTNTLPTNIESCDNVGYQLIFSGDPVGNFFVEASFDGQLWVQLDLGTPGPQANGNPDSHLISLRDIPYPQVRVIYQAISGSGNLDVWVMAKRKGG